MCSHSIIALMRHGEAETVSATGKDYDRALSKNGVIQATVAGKLLKQTINTPEIILCSPSLRTRQTLDAIHFEHPVKTIFNDKLYYGSVTDYLSMIVSAVETGFPALVIGHNPTISTAISRLSHSDNRSSRFSKMLRPAGFAVIDFPEHIGENIAGQGHLVTVTQP